MDKGLIIFICVLIILAGCVYMVKLKIEEMSRKLFGTKSIVDGMNKVANEVAKTPKSVSSMTKLMEPQIAKDFPEFVWDEFKHKAENMLMAALTAISTKDISQLPEDTSEAVRQQIRNTIENNEASEIEEHYDSIHIHQTEIANYKKVNGKCIITIQSAVQYYHYKEKAGKIICGEKDRLKQTKYNIELLYIQDSRLAGYDNTIGATCPNCGAPITNLGAKFCDYCGTGVIPINIKVWSLHNFAEVDYNHVL